jgi:glycosyltransferase involved in cell wall biosynthesis
MAEASKNVTFRGWQPLEQVAAEMQSSAAVVVPSVEDYGLVGAEALACGTPVVCPNEGGGADYVRPGLNGELFQSDDVGSLTAAIKAVLSASHEAVYVAETVAHLRRQAFEASVKTVLSAV